MIKLTRVPSKGEEITIIYSDGEEVKVADVAAAAHELGLEESHIKENLVDDPNVTDFQMMEVMEDDDEDDDKDKG